LWRGLVDDGQRYHLLAIRNLPGAEIRLCPGGAVEPFDTGRFAHRYPPEVLRFSDPAECVRIGAKGYLDQRG